MTFCRAGSYNFIHRKAGVFYMQKYMIKSFKSENRPVWFMEKLSGLPTKAQIIEICNNDQVGEYAKVHCIHDNESHSVGSQGVLFENLYPSKDALLTATAEAEQKRIAEIKAAIHSMEDCIRFMYNTPGVSPAEEYTDHIARRAIQEIAAERWGLELE